MSILQLIPVEAGKINGQTTQLVDARLLHEFLESKQDFSVWIKSRIRKYGFFENEDYLLHKIVEQVPHQGGVRTTARIDYHLTLNMAKELAMVERSEKGRQARRYFIACERQLREAMKQEQGLSLEAELIQRASRYHLGGFNKSMINRFVWQNGTALAQQAFHRAAAALCSIMEREKLKHKLEQLTIIQGIKRTAKAKQRIQDDIDHINWLLAQSEAEQ
jgi:phage anti-repressor protein